MKLTTFAAIIAATTAISGAAAAQMAPEATMQPIPNPPEMGSMSHEHMGGRHMMSRHHHMMSKHHMMGKHHRMAMKKMKAEAKESTTPAAK